MAKYGGYPLRVVGSDMTTPNVGLPGVGLNPTGNQAGEIMQANSRRLQGAASELAQGAQLASQISSGITENQIQANNASLAVGQAQVQASAARAQTAGQFAGQLSSTLFNYWSETNKQRAAQEEVRVRAARQAEEDRRELIRLQMSIEDHERQQKAFESDQQDKETKRLREQLIQNQQLYESEVAIKDFGALFADAQGIIFNNGSQELKDRLNEISERHRGRVRPEFIVEWSDRILRQADDEQDRQLNAQYENIRQLRNVQQSETVQRFDLQVFAIGEQMAAGVIDINQGIESIDGIASSFIKDNNLDLMTSLQVRQKATEIMLKSGRISAADKAKIQKYGENLNYAVSEINKLRQEESIRAVPQEERDYRILQIANETGIPLTDLQRIAPDYTTLLQRNIKEQELVLQLDTLTQQKLVSEANKVQFGQHNVGDAVGKLITSNGSNYESVMALLENPTFKGVRFWEQVRATYKDWAEYEKFKTSGMNAISKLREQQLEARIRVEKLLAGGEDPNTFLDQIKQVMIANAQKLPEEMRPYGETAANRALNTDNVVNLVAAIDQEYQAQIAAITQQIAIKQQSMAVYGLDNVFPSKGQTSSLDLMRTKYKEEINRYTQMIDSLPVSQSVQSGSSSPFSQGSTRLAPITSGIGLSKTTDGITHRPIKATTALQPVKWKGATFLSPFKPGTQLAVSDDWGGQGSEVYARRGRPHAGIDFAVASGTPIVAPVGGKVVNVRTQIGANGRGYGQYIDVRIPDGRVMRFAHVSGSYVTMGQDIEPGQVIAKSGDSGSPGAHHLHFEIRDGQKEFYFDGSSDPKQFLSMVQSGYVTAVPRRQNDVVNTQNPFKGGQQPPVDKPLPPMDSVGLPFGRYIKSGMIYEPDSRKESEFQPKSETHFDTTGGLAGLPFRAFIGNKKAVDYYNRAHPLPQMTVPSHVNTADSKASNVKGNNFGYSILTKNPQWSDKLVEFADWLGVPAVWVADVLYFESTLNPDMVNQFGCTGLAQFCDVQRDEFGGMNAIKQAGFIGQIDLLKKYFQKWGLRGQITSIAEMYTAFQRPAHVKRLKRGDKSVLEQKDGNGKSIKYYIENYIGREAGRRYTVEQNRRKRAVNTTHDKYIAGCTVCNQLVRSNSPLIPHQLEDLA